MTSAQHCIKHCVSLAADIASSIASNIAPNIALRHETRLARHVVLCIPNSGNQLLLVILLPGVHDDPSFLGDKSGCSVGCFTGELFLSLIKEARPSTSLLLPRNLDPLQTAILERKFSYPLLIRNVGFPGILFRSC